MIYSIDNLIEAKNHVELFERLDEIAVYNLDESFVMKDAGLSSRVYNHYVSLGLISNKLKENDYRFKFSFVDLVWINMIKDLREFGFALDKIKKVYDQLMSPQLLLETLRELDDKQKAKVLKRISVMDMDFESDIEKENFLKTIKNEITFQNDTTKKNIDLIFIPLHLIIGEMIIHRQEAVLFIDRSGNVALNYEKTDPEDLNRIIEELGFDNEAYIRISLLKYFKRFILKEENRNFIQKNNLINGNELYILSLIREGKAKAITIKFQDNKPAYIEISEERKIYAESRISETILKKEYQEIIIKTQEGDIAYANVVTKKKLK